MPAAQLLALVGPTASGKTEAAIAVASRLGCEVVSCDSMLVYRGMDIGTAKPTLAEQTAVPHHLIDVADPEEPFSVAAYQQLAFDAAREIDERGVRALVAGGSGLYYRAIVDRLEFPGTDAATRRDLEVEARAAGPSALHQRLAAFDPDAAAKIEAGNARRTVRALEVAAITGRAFSSYAVAWEDYPPGAVRVAGLELDRDVLATRVRERVDRMLAEGFADEVAGLVDRGFGGWLTATQAIGYAELARHLAGDLTLEEAVAGTVRRTKALARRQMAWFRRDPRIRWFRAGAQGAASLSDELAEYLDG